jgi:hypothetical protein
MAYTVPNFKSKKALKEAVAFGTVQVFQPGIGGPQVKDGRCAIEGPHYPAPHTWYADVEVKGGCIPMGSKVR